MAFTDWNVGNLGREPVGGFDDMPGLMDRDPSADDVGPSFFGGGGGQFIPPPQGASFAGPSSAPVFGGTPGQWGVPGGQTPKSPWGVPAPLTAMPQIQRPDWLNNYEETQARADQLGSGGWTPTYVAPQSAPVFQQGAHGFQFQQTPAGWPAHGTPLPMERGRSWQREWPERGEEARDDWNVDDHRGGHWAPGAGLFGHSPHPEGLQRRVSESGAFRGWPHGEPNHHFAMNHAFGQGNSAPGTPFLGFGATMPQQQGRPSPWSSRPNTPLPPHAPPLSPFKRTKSKSRTRRNSFPGLPPGIHHLVPRPTTWRASFNAPSTANAPATSSGLFSFNPFSKHKSTIREVADTVKRKLNPLLASPKLSTGGVPKPNILYDMHQQPELPSAVVFPGHLGHYPQQLLSSPATNPPAPWMRLWHARLPWYIDVVPLSGGQVTVGDVLIAVRTQILQQTAAEDFFTIGLHDADREAITGAFGGRCQRFPMEQQAGLRRLDYLCGAGTEVFTGLGRSKNGMWEMSFSPA